MDNLKRIFAILIAIIMTFAYIVSAEGEYTVKNTEEIDFLSAIGFADTEKTDFFQNMTRGEFAQIYTKILNKGLIYTGNGKAFADMDEKNEYFSAVSFMSQMGYMNGHSDGTFRPNGNISYDEAVSVIVKILGYGVKANAKGGYPAGYKITANELKLLNGFNVSDTSALTIDEAFKLIYNSLFIALSEQTEFGKKVSYSSDKGNTLLNTFLEIDYTEGLLEDNSYSSLSGDSNIKDGAISVNGIVMENATNQAKSYLGYNVRAYYKTDDTKAFMYITLLSDKNECITVDAEDILPASTLTLLKYKQGKNKTQKTAKITANAYYIKNGEAIKSLTDSDLKIKSGTVTLLDYDGNKVYDAIFIDEFQTMLYKSRSNDKKTLYGYYDEKINLENEENTVIYKDGEEVLFKQLMPYDVIAVSKGKNYTKIEICTNVIQGNLSEISEDKYIIDGKEYKLAYEYEHSALKKPSVGTNGDFYIGKNNLIAYFEEENREKIGIAVNLSKKRGSLETRLPQIKIYKTDGKFEIFDFESRIEINGSRIDSEDIYDKTELHSNGDFVRQPVAYELSEQGRIEKLQFPDSTKPDTDVLQAYCDTAREFRNYNPGTDAVYPITNLTGENNSSVFIGNKTWYFKLPSDVNEERFYSVSRGELPYNHNAVIPNLKIYFASYDNKRYCLADIVTTVTAVSRVGSWNERQMIVNDITNGINPDGDNCQILKGYVKGKETVYYADDAIINGVVPGDILQLTANGDTIARYRKVYSIEKDKTCTEWLESHSADGQLYEFYDIDDPNSVNGMGYYINTELLASSSLFTHKNGDESRGSVYVSGYVTGKNGNYLEVTCDDGEKKQFFLNSDNGDYYSTFAYRFNKENETAKAETFENIGLDERVAVFTEAFSVIDIAVIE